jgi:hypothetical protein
MPGAGRTHGPPATRKAGGSHHRSSQNIRHSLRDGFTAYTCAPRSAGLVSLRRFVDDVVTPQGLVPASGDQDYTTSPSVRMPFVHAACALNILPSTGSRPQRS